MASAAVVTAIQAALAANWTATPSIQPNTESLVPDDGSAFLVLEFPPVGDETQITLGPQGSRIFREEGAFVVTLCIPVGIGVNPAATPWLTQFDALRAALRGQNFANVNTLGASPAHENGDSERGAYYELSSAVPYYFDLSNG